MVWKYQRNNLPCFQDGSDQMSEPNPTPNSPVCIYCDCHPEEEEHEDECPEARHG